MCECAFNVYSLTSSDVGVCSLDLETKTSLSQLSLDSLLSEERVLVKSGRKRTTGFLSSHLQQAAVAAGRQ